MSAARGYRDVRPHVVPESLDELTGPSDGQVVLPTRLDWGPERVYRLEDPVDARLLYERVIREALRVDDLRTFLSKDVLLRLWPDLFLPPAVRQLWSSRLGLASAVRAA